MRLIGTGLLDSFCKDHADCRKWIANWILDVRNAKWKTTHDIKRSYAAASFLSDNVVIFNVRGNDYRMETQVAWKVGVIAIKWVGTHAEYSKRSR